MTSSQWHVYFVRMPSGALYCGITTDVERRFAQHCNGTGAKALKGKAPLALAWQAVAGVNRSQASKLELKLKKLSKNQKEGLVSGQIKLENLFLDNN